ncbi:L,D-transpeptidase family protein [Kitasatospora acidiphila]|uniref:L,D-transpeptidase family protein n=1 Tax=Kitasatospora acidiphila TaxID=2567942 RepID=A0A540W753_9ACTN|nr:Ig-like domain-containing protein [Kitasatospora acidiphila]TQF04842.1 L,D-transpeptidase family protein [Kitasatospora acidiphila]
MRSRGIPGTVAALLLGGALLLTTACSSGTGGGTGGSATAPAAAGHSGAQAKPSAATLAVLPADGSQNVAPSGAVKVSVTDGKLTQVTVTGPDGKPVAGTVGPDGSWAPTAALSVSTKYQVNANAVDASGVATTTTSSFSTLTPSKTERVRDNLDNNATYGVGMIISVTFDKAVTNKQAAEQAITVEATDGTTVKGHWFGPNRLDLRPENYWKPGTKVSVHRRVSGVELSPGVYGDSDTDEAFTIGRSKVSTADAGTHQMTVVEDGAPTKTIAITAGADDNPSWNGTMVVFEKDRMVHMDSKTTNIKGAGYDVYEPHGLKITDTGSYVHGNPKAVDWAGKANISHGCIGLPDTDQGEDDSVAGKFWGDSIIGDVVIVQHSVGEPVAPDNGLGGWNLPWAQWS